MKGPMSMQTEPSVTNDDKTMAGRPCPRCGAMNALAQLPEQGYTCQQCGFDLAYLDYTATGGVRGVLGWVRVPGSIIHDRYRVQTVLGRGGFGSTYLVSDLRLNGRSRALKEIPPNMFDDQEPMLLSRLEHPGIPDITDRFDCDGLICLVLEFGGSQTLEGKRKEMGGRIPLPQLLPWLCQLCDVLHYLHNRQPPIIHRDLKPGNILLDENDRIRLIDFGIAKIAAPSEATHTLGRAISQGFSSPEQIAGSGTDQRSDIYGLGATVYYLLSGVHPPSLSERISNKPLQRLAELVPGIAPEIERAVTQALELNADKRQQSIKELWDVFTEFSPRSRPAGPKPATRPGRSGRRSVVAAVLLALIVLAAAIAAGIYFFRPQQVPEQQAERQPPPVDQPDKTPAATPSPPPAAPQAEVRMPPAPPQAEPQEKMKGPETVSQPTPAAPEQPQAAAPPAAKPKTVRTERKPAAAVPPRVAEKQEPPPQPQPPEKPPAAAPVQEAPAKQQKETDWGGTMQWIETRPKSP
jgi:serine/threonine-protein kinase